MATKDEPVGIVLLPYAERVKLVRERLNGWRYPRLTELAKSAKVLAAEKVIEAWSARNQEHQDAQRQEHRAKLNAVQDALIVGDVQKAVALLKQYGA